MSQGDLLLNVALQLGSELRLDNLLPMVLKSAAKLMDAERALFALVDSHGALQRVKLHNLEWAPGSPLPVSEKAIQEAVEKGHTVHVDVANDPFFAAHHSVRLHNISFIVAQPIFVESEVAAILYIDSQLAVPGSIGPKMELLEALAALVGTAVHRSRLFEEQRYRAQLLAQMVHDFRAPLMVVRNTADILEEDPNFTDEALVHDLAASAERIMRMIDSTLELSRVDAGVARPDVQTVDLTVTVPQHVKRLERVARSASLELQCVPPKTLPPVRTIPERIQIVLDNLVFNAIKHSDPNTTITVRFAIRGDAGPHRALHRRAGEASHLFRRIRPLRPVAQSQFVEVSVYNVGNPIPPALLPRLFDDYSRGDRKAGGHPSTGLGLSIVDQCVRFLGGAVWVDSGAERATCFKFTLPTRVHSEVEDY